MPSGSRNSLFPMLATAVCLVVGMIALFALLSELRGNRHREGVPIGEVVQANGSVQVKPPQHYVWTELDVGSVVYRGEWLKTGSRSAVTVRLADGRQLKLGADAILLLDEKPARADAAQAKRGADAPAGTVTAEPPARGVPLTAPRAGHLVRTARDEGGVIFQWDSPPGRTEPLDLEISTRRDFPATATRRHPAGRGETLVFLPPGSYFWRLTSAGKPQSEVRDFTIVRQAPDPPPRSPSSVRSSPRF